MIKLTGNKKASNFVLLSRSRKGMAIFMVLGLVAILIPVMYIFSQYTSSQNKQSLKFYEYQLKEQVTTDGMKVLVGKVRAGRKKYTKRVINEDGSVTSTVVNEYSSMPDEYSGDQKFSSSVYKTGVGMLNQSYYSALTQCEIDASVSNGIFSKKAGKYTMLADVEQFTETKVPCLSVFDNFYGSVEPYNINANNSVLDFQNKRGVELLNYIDNIEFEQGCLYQTYENLLNNKKNMLPEILQDDWDEIVNYMLFDKAN